MGKWLLQSKKWPLEVAPESLQIWHASIAERQVPAMKDSFNLAIALTAVQRGAFHPSLLHQVADGLELGHDLGLLFLGHRLYTVQEWIDDEQQKTTHFCKLLAIIVLRDPEGSKHSTSDSTSHWLQFKLTFGKTNLIGSELFLNKQKKETRF